MLMLDFILSSILKTCATLHALDTNVLIAVRIVESLKKFLISMRINEIDFINIYQNDSKYCKTIHFKYKQQ